MKINFKSLLVGFPLILFGLFFGRNIVLAGTASHVVISQIQIDSVDGVGGTEDDWVELYNPTATDVDLSTWSIQKTSETGGSFYRKSLSGIIPAYGYFLIVRNHANTDPAIVSQANILAAGSSFSLSDDNTIYLVKNNEDIVNASDPDIVDMVGMGQAESFEGIAVGNPADGESIERLPGSGQGNGKDTDNNQADFFMQAVPHPRNSSFVESPVVPEPEPEPVLEDNLPQGIGAISEPFVLEFSEIMPNPDGADSGSEWVEIYNPASKAFDLTGWYLDDEGNTTAPGSGAHVIETGTVIPAKGFLQIVIPKGSFALNNSSGDTVRLFDSEKILQLSKSYQDPASSGKSYAKDEYNDWYWTEIPTPGAKNIFPAEVVYSTNIRISEIHPNPPGDDAEGEFVELLNIGQDSVDLTGWILADNRGKYVISEDDYFDTEIGAGQYFVIYREVSGLTLNNSGDEQVSLYNPAEELVDEIAFDAVGKGEQSFALDGSKFVWTRVATPGTANKIVQTEPSDLAEVDDDEAQVKLNSNVLVVELSEIRNHPTGSIVETSGVVVVEPGVLETNVIYLQGSGIRVVFDTLPEFEIEAGMVLSLTGEISSYHNELQLKVADLELVFSRGEFMPVLPHEINTGEVGEATEGVLVSLTGTVTSQAGNTFFIDDGSGEARIYIKEETSITKPPFKKGQEVLVVGIVSQFNDNYRVMPRYQSDIVVSGVAGAFEEGLPRTGIEIWLIVAFFLAFCYIGVASFSVK